MEPKQTRFCFAVCRAIACREVLWLGKRVWTSFRPQHLLSLLAAAGARRVCSAPQPLDRSKNSSKMYYPTGAQPLQVRPLNRAAPVGCWRGLGCLHGAAARPGDLCCHRRQPPAIMPSPDPPHAKPQAAFYCIDVECVATGADHNARAVGQISLVVGGGGGSRGPPVGTHGGCRSAAAAAASAACGSHTPARCTWTLRSTGGSESSGLTHLAF